MKRVKLLVGRLGGRGGILLPIVDVRCGSGPPGCCCCGAAAAGPSSRKLEKGLGLPSPRLACDRPVLTRHAPDGAGEPALRRDGTWVTVGGCGTAPAPAPAAAGATHVAGSTPEAVDVALPSSDLT